MSTPDTPDVLAARLARLEHEQGRLRRESRRWRRGFVATLVAAGALVLSGQGGASKVTADSVRLKGPDGKLRGLLSVTDKGHAALSLMDADQKPRTVLSVSPEGSSKFSFLTADAKLRMTLSMNHTKSPALIFTAPDGKTRLVSLTADPPGLILNNDQGQDRALIAVNSKGAGVLRTKDAAGKPK